MDQNKKLKILNWWNRFEQQSIAQAINYNYIASTDITDFYPSIYTHTISWALHGIDCAKKNIKCNNLLGNKIDNIMEKMNYGQTIGKPQGNSLMDFISELILGYADLMLSDKLKELNINDYYILRYRDDYKIFSNNISNLKLILKELTEILLKLNTKKTFINDDIINSSVKSEKLYLLKNPIDSTLNLQKKLLVINKIKQDFSNSGIVITLLSKIYSNEIENLKIKPNNFDQIISIIVNIMYNNSRTYSISIAILSKILTFAEEKKKNKIISKIELKFLELPSTTYLSIWLQRISILTNRSKIYDSLICQKLYKEVIIWNSSWLNYKIDESLIIDEYELKNLSPVIPIEEANWFSDYR